MFDAYLDIETTGLSRYYDEITVMSIYLGDGMGRQLVRFMDAVTKNNIFESYHTSNLTPFCKKGKGGLCFFTMRGSKLIIVSIYPPFSKGGKGDYAAFNRKLETHHYPRLSPLF
jgi:hypothetical protein